MPRIAVILFALLAASPALAASCGERVQAFTSYEDYDDQMQLEHKVSVFPVPPFSPHSAFEGLLVKNSESPKLKVSLEWKRKGKSASKSWEFVDESVREGFRATKDLDASEFLGFAPGSFKLRLVNEGKVLCEDEYGIESGD